MSWSFVRWLVSQRELVLMSSCKSPSPKKNGKDPLNVGINPYITAFSVYHKRSLHTSKTAKSHPRIKKKKRLFIWLFIFKSSSRLGISNFPVFYGMHFEMFLGSINMVAQSDWMDHPQSFRQPLLGIQFIFKSCNDWSRMTHLCLCCNHLDWWGKHS